MKKTTTFLIMLMVILTTFGATNLVGRYVGSDILIGNASADPTDNVTEGYLDAALTNLSNDIKDYLNMMWEDINITRDNASTILAILGEYTNETIKEQLEAINATINSFIFENVTNDSVMARLNTILRYIEGNNSVGNWSIYDTQKYILRGLIDKDENYILHNGTLIDLEGTSVLKVMLANQIVLSNQDGMIADLVRNSTQTIVDVSDDNKLAIQGGVVDVGNQIVGSFGTITWLLGILCVLAILYMLWKIVFKNRLQQRKEKRSGGYPTCYGDPKIFNRTKCVPCTLIDECEGEVISSEAQVEKKQDCFGQYLASATACKKCRNQLECKKVTPGGDIPSEQPEQATSNVVENPLDSM